MLAQRLPAHVRLVVASQHNPVFSTSRLRLAGVITELRADDLAFTQVEVEQLLELAGLGREHIDGRRLRCLTEGWPAGLQMAVLAMRAGGDPREVIDAFASTTKETSDYLANEVMNRLPPDLADFLTSICVLDEFDAQLCQAVSGRDDAGQLLDRVIADDLFIYQVDLAGERFRLHQMFAAFLRARLKSLGGTQFREAHLRAAAALQAARGPAGGVASCDGGGRHAAGRRYPGRLHAHRPGVHQRARGQGGRPGVAGQVRRRRRGSQP